MATAREKAERFLSQHHEDGPLLMPNAWDAGSAKILVSLGFQAIATTSSGHAATLGRLDGSVTVDEALDHAGTLAAAVDVPVSCDFEHGFADAPDDVAANVRRLAATGVAGGSVEDSTGRADDPIYDAALAAERVAAAAEAAHGADAPIVLTARAENYLHGLSDLADTIARLQAYQAAGADVLYAPGIIAADDIRSVVTSVDRPVNVIAIANVPDIATLRDLGVARVSIGGGFAFAALGALVQAGRELLDQGTYSFRDLTAIGAKAARSALR